MRKITLSLSGLLLIALISSCTSINSTKKTTDTNCSHCTSEKISGVYHAVFPCASCPGIDTWITVYKDETGLKFKMTERYLEEKKAFFTYKGVAKKLENSTVLQLQRKNDEIYFLIGDNYLSLIGDKINKTEDIFSYRLYKMPGMLIK